MCISTVSSKAGLKSCFNKNGKKPNTFFEKLRSTVTINLDTFNGIEETEYQTPEDQAVRTLNTFQVLPLKNFFWLPVLNFSLLLEPPAFLQPS